MSARTRSIARAPASLGGDLGAPPAAGRHAGHTGAASAGRCSRHRGARRCDAAAGGRGASGAIGATVVQRRHRRAAGRAAPSHASPPASAGPATQGSSMLLRPSRSASSRQAIWSRSVSSASNSPARRGDGVVADEQPRFHQVGELAQPHRACHPRAALERVQRPPQLLALRCPPARGARRAAARPPAERVRRPPRGRSAALCASTSSRTSASGSTSGCGRRGPVGDATGVGVTGGGTGVRLSARASSSTARGGRLRRARAPRPASSRLRPRRPATLSASSIAAAVCRAAPRARSDRRRFVGVAGAGSDPLLDPLASGNCEPATARASTGCAAPTAAERHAAAGRAAPARAPSARRRRAGTRRCDECRTACDSREPSAWEAPGAGRTAAAAARVERREMLRPPRRPGSRTGLAESTTPPTLESSARDAAAAACVRRSLERHARALGGCAATVAGRGADGGSREQRRARVLSDDSA